MPTERDDAKRRHDDNFAGPVRARLAVSGLQWRGALAADAIMPTSSTEGRVEIWALKTVSGASGLSSCNGEQRANGVAVGSRRDYEVRSRSLDQSRFTESNESRPGKPEATTGTKSAATLPEEKEEVVAKAREPIVPDRRAGLREARADAGGPVDNAGRSTRRA